MSRPRSSHYFIPIWTEAPMLRLLPPLILGITAQWYLQIPLLVLLVVAALLCIGCILFSWFYTLKNKLIIGIGLQLLFFSLGALVVWLQDTRHQPTFISKHYQDSSLLVATLQEPLVEKSKSYKAEASVQIFENGQLKPVSGHILVYFQKDTSSPTPPLTYGSQIVFKTPLQSIKNAGNPGGFDYERYSGFHGIYYQVFLKPQAYTVLSIKQIVPFRQMLFDIQKWVLSTFQQWIPGKQESGVAEALLIGYRNDLDMDLVQQYSNTGVVHIIAISGMHLGLIYGLLLILFMPFGKKKGMVIIRAVSIITLLWVFSILTGAAPSIVRSAVMFTILVLGQTQKRKASIYNNLACSAFLLLLFDPFCLWDVGFQLSYAAVLSIAIFGTPLSRLLYFKAKWKSYIWQLCMVTMAAQIITYPIVAFHFHQFPNLFLLTNIIAVPLSSFILYVLIGLLCVSWIPGVGMWVGKLAGLSIWAMNAFIGLIDQLSFALTDGIYFTLPQTIVLLFVIAFASCWIMRKSAGGFVAALCSMAIFCGLRTWQFAQDASQHKMIVYNVPQHAAIDIIEGNQYVFMGDSILQQDGFLQNFHLKPSRVLHQIEEVDTLQNVAISLQAFQLGNKKIVVVKGKPELENADSLQVDVVIISGNPTVLLSDVEQAFHPTQIVIDASNSRRKMSRWQKEAETLHLRLHSVASDGAYTLNW